MKKRKVESNHKQFKAKNIEFMGMKHMSNHKNNYMDGITK
mgnify:FL=1